VNGSRRIYAPKLWRSGPVVFVGLLLSLLVDKEDAVIKSLRHIPMGGKKYMVDLLVSLKKGLSKDKV